MRLEEVTYGTPVAAVAADAFKVINPGPAMKPEQAVIRGNEKTASRSQSPSLPCASIVSTIAVPVYVEPSGTPGTPPDANLLYKNLMGAEVISAGEVRYELRDPVPSTLSVFSYIQQLPQVSSGRYSTRASFHSPTNYCSACSPELAWTFWSQGFRPNRRRR